MAETGTRFEAGQRVTFVEHNIALPVFSATALLLAFVWAVFKP